MRQLSIDYYRESLLALKEVVPLAGFMDIGHGRVVTQARRW
jgi:hypothetical protein